MIEVGPLKEIEYKIQAQSFLVGKFQVLAKFMNEQNKEYVQYQLNLNCV